MIQRGAPPTILDIRFDFGAILCRLGRHKWFAENEQWATVQPSHRKTLQLEPGLYLVTWCERPECMRRGWTPAALVKPKEAKS